MPESGTNATFLPFLVIEEEAEDRDSMGRLFRRDDATVILRNIPVETLRANLRPIVGALRSLFDELTDSSSDVQLREAQVGIEVSASGGIQLVGTAQIGATTLVFRKD